MFVKKLIRALRARAPLCPTPLDPPLLHAQLKKILITLIKTVGLSYLNKHGFVSFADIITKLSAAVYTGWAKLNGATYATSHFFVTTERFNKIK